MSDSSITFRTALRGYDTVQVDHHMNELAHTAASVWQQSAEQAREINELKAANDQLKSEVKGLTRKAHSLEETLRESEEPTYAGFGERIGTVLRLVETEALDLRTRAQADAANRRALAEEDALAIRQDADGYAMGARSAADDQVAQILDDARQQAQGVVDEARQQADNALEVARQQTRMRVPSLLPRLSTSRPPWPHGGRRRRGSTPRRSPPPSISWQRSGCGLSRPAVTPSRRSRMLP